MKSTRFFLCAIAILFTLTIQSAPAQTAHSSGGNFGSVNVGASAASPATVTFTFDTGGTLGSMLVVTQGATGLDYTDAGTGTCTANTSYKAGDTCTVDVAFKPLHPGPRYGAAELLDGSGNLVGLGYLQGTGAGPQAVFANTASSVYLPSKQTTLSNVFGWPIGVAVDASGNVFVADTQHWAVKEIVAVNGSIPASPTIKTLGSSIIYPWRVAVDGAGNVFVGNDMTSQSDCCGTVYEMVAAGGYTTVKTLRSGFKGPANLTVDGSGDVFVAECVDNGGVKEMLAAGGYTAVNTLGSGFGAPCGVAVDGSGNVFVSDGGSNTVKEIVVAGGYTTVKTLASIHSDGAAVDASGDVFFADNVGNAVHEILAAGGYTTILTLGSGFNSPSGVAVDGSGNVFVADYNNNAAIKLDFADPPSLTFAETIAGGSGDSPQTVTVSNVGNADLKFSDVAYPADFPEASGDTNSCTGSTSLSLGESCDLPIEFDPAEPGTFSEAVTMADNAMNVAGTQQSITVSGAGVAVVEGATHFSVTATAPSASETVGTPFSITVKALTLAGATATTYNGTVRFTSSDPGFVNPGQLTLSGGTGQTTVTLEWPGTQTIAATDTTTASVTGSGSFTVVGPPPITGPAGGVSFGSFNIGIAPASSAAVTFTFNIGATLGSMLVVTQGATGLDYTDAGTGTCTANTSYKAGGTCTVDVAFKPKYPGPRYGAAELLDDSGNLLATGYVRGTGVGPQAVFADTTSGTYLPNKQSILGSGFNGPVGAAVDSSGNVFVADRSNNAVKEILASGGYTTVNTLVSGLNSPNGVAVDGAGNLFATDSDNHAVKEVLAVGGYTIVRTLGSGFNTPAGLSVDGSGNVFVSDWDNSAVYEILAASGYTTVNTLGRGFLNPDDTAVDTSGNIFVSDHGHNAVKEILAVGGYTTVNTLGSGFNGPGAVVVDASGNVYVADEGNSAVKEIVAAGGYTTVNTLGNGFGTPAGIAMDGSGNLFVTDYRSSTVTKLDYTDPPSLRFATTVAGETSSDSPQTVTVINDGNANLVFSALSYPTDFPEANGVDTDCTASSVVAGGTSCKLSIEFTPQPSSLSGASTLLSESIGLTTDSLNATTAQSVGVSGTGVVATAAELTSPTPSTVLAGPTIKFTWGAAPAATGYALLLGTSVGASNVYNSGSITATSVTPANLPTNGETIYARLYTYFGTDQVHNDYVFTAAAQAALSSPAPSTVLAGPEVAFTWNDASGATGGYRLELGTSQGAKNIWSSGLMTATSINVWNLPTNGETIYARLYTYYGSTGVYADYIFTAATRAALTSPAPSTLLAAPEVTFTWSAAPGATDYRLVLGTSQGSNNIFGTGPIPSTSFNVWNLPTNGETVYARLYTYYGTAEIVQVYTDYTYTAATQAALTSPAPGTVLAGSKITFAWSAAPGASNYRLVLGTSQGASDIFGTGPTTATSVTPWNLPTNGETVYARLYTYYGESLVYTDYTYTAAP